MKYCLIVFASILFFSFTPSNEHIKTIYNSLDDKSITELFAFYSLYPKSPYGQRAKARAWHLLNIHRPDEKAYDPIFSLPEFDVKTIVSFVNKQPHETKMVLKENQLNIIDSLSDHLTNRLLPGHYIWDTEGIKDLQTHEVDLARAVLLYQFNNDKDKVRQYEANLDMMALQVLARLEKDPTNIEKVRAINEFIFHEMKYRFPPHSMWVGDVDLYTFLPSVLDSRHGVCLGVSILFISLAQRLDLPLEIVTPPGHIYVSYISDGKELNIETTARGIHVPTKHYYGINTISLPKRTVKEVIGLGFINQAAALLQKKEYAESLKLYELAKIYLDDIFLDGLLGFNYLYVGDLEKGKKLLKEVVKSPLKHTLFRETTAEDYLNGKVDIKGIETIYMHVDETRESILVKQKALNDTLEMYPNFRDGILQLAITWLQLSRGKEAMEVLQKYHSIDSNNPTVEYYLCVLSMQRFDLLKAFKHFHNLDKLLKKDIYTPEAYKGIKMQLKRFDPTHVL